MRSKTTSAVSAAFLVLVTLALLAVSKVHSSPSSASSSSAVHPVLLELFTSEGCSSCPPADAFLKQMDDAGRVDGIETIAIEEHVDYWDQLGWRDPFSSHRWTERQEQYAEAFRRDGIYTPQFIVNGHSEMSGSSPRKARQDILEAAKISDADLHLAVVGASQSSAEVLVTAENIPPEARSPELWLAISERGLSSDVLRGENQGRNLTHAAILRSLTQIRNGAAANSSGSVETKATVPLDPSWKRGNLRLVVFLQDRKTLHIIGAAASSLPR